MLSRLSNDRSSAPSSYLHENDPYFQLRMSPIVMAYGPNKILARFENGALSAAHKARRTRAEPTDVSDYAGDRQLARSRVRFVTVRTNDGLLLDETDSRLHHNGNGKTDSGVANSPDECEINRLRSATRPSGMCKPG